MSNNDQALALRPSSIDLVIKTICAAALLAVLYAAYVFIGAVSLVFSNEIYANALGPTAVAFFKFLVLPLAAAGLLFFIYSLFSAFFERASISGNALVVKSLFKTKTVPLADISRVQIGPFTEFIGSTGARLGGHVLRKLLGVSYQIVVTHGANDQELILSEASKTYATQIKKTLDMARA